MLRGGVLYYSATAKKWTSAKALRVNVDGSYDFDRKRRVTVDRIRSSGRGLQPPRALEPSHGGTFQDLLSVDDPVAPDILPVAVIAFDDEIYLPLIDLLVSDMFSFVVHLFP